MSKHLDSAIANLEAANRAWKWCIGFCIAGALVGPVGFIVMLVNYR